MGNRTPFLTVLLYSVSIILLLTTVFTDFFAHAFAQIRLSNNMNTYTNVRLLSSDLVNYARAHNGFNPDLSTGSSFEDYATMLIKKYGLEDSLSFSDISCSPAIGTYTQRLDEITVSIGSYKYENFDPTKDKTDIGGGAMSGESFEVKTKGAGHVKHPNEASNYELDEEDRFGDSL